MGPRLLAACLSTVLALMVVVIDSGWMKHLDTATDLWFSRLRTRGALAAGQDIWNAIGNPVAFAIVVVGCGAWFSWRVRSVMPMGVMVAAVGLGGVLEQTLKFAVSRTAATGAAARGIPKPLNFQPFLHSFPSGHMTVIGVFLGTVAVCLCAGRRLAVKIRLGVLTAAVVAFVGLLAVYIRSHLFTDVVGGAILSAAILAMTGPTLAAAMSRGARVSTNRAVPARPAAAGARSRSASVG